jgi:hypothetical protein
MRQEIDRLRGDERKRAEQMLEALRWLTEKDTGKDDQESIYRRTEIEAAILRWGNELGMHADMHIAVRECARCLRDHHEPVHFKPLSNPPEEFTHWGMCPTTREPIVMKVVEVPIDQRNLDITAATSRADLMQQMSAELKTAKDDLSYLRQYAHRTYNEWDADNDSKVGKRLAALAGTLVHYDARLDRIHGTEEA